MQSRAELKALLKRQESFFRLAFRAFIAENKSPQARQRIKNLIHAGKHEELLKQIDQSIIRFGNVVPKIFMNVAHATADHFKAASLGKAKPKPTIAVTFDPTNERAAAIMRSSRLNFIQQFTVTQRVATRTALADAFKSGVGTEAAAQSFVDSIGLTDTQMAAVDNYRTLLEEGSSASLDRVLRDRRFDSTVEDSVGPDGDPLTDDQIDTMVDAYQSRMLDYRAENIARTQSLGVMSQARHEATQQMIEDTDMDPALVVRTWMATDDNRTRDSHIDMDGQEVGVDEPFVTPDGDELMYPGDPDGPPEEIINCRCTVGIDILHDASERADAA